MEYVLTLFLIAASSSPPAACNFYAARDYPLIKLEERERTITITWEAWHQTVEKVVTKQFGALLEGAYDPEKPKSLPYVFTRTKVDGMEAIIFSSMVFFPDCPKGHK
jgi:hypothetical protein